jgi:hypothetical protein
MTPEERDGLLAYATERQAEYLNACVEHGGQRGAARHFGVRSNAVDEAIALVRKKAARAGWAPENGLEVTNPPGYVTGKVTVQQRGQTVERVWKRMSPEDADREAAMQAAVEAFAEDLPRVPATPAPANTHASLLAHYPIADAHLSMLAWSKETGADWDIDIAEQTLTRCMGQLLAGTPDASTAVIAQLGDFLHSDGQEPVTPTSGNVLDRDTRFEKSVAVAIRTIRRIIGMALNKHQHVQVIMAEGNHDISSSVWLRQMLAAFYENEPRVTVNTSPLPYYAHQHGEVMLAWHHGHLKKFDRLGGFMAAQFPQMWGQTRYRYAHCGHLHHMRQQDTDGITIVQHETLAARDSHAARHGYTSSRGMTAEVYHENYGLVGTNKVRPEMVSEAA